ncbi:hypothetical protein KBC55_03550 [Patescibacteria group bacterium]|nr:hypothetical protein [Patescibacteria group bacterium]
MQGRRAFFFIPIVLGLFFSFVPVQVQAQGEVESEFQDILSQGIVFAGICDSATAPCACRDVGQCQLDDILQLFVNVSILILGISGSIVLLMFVWGGLQWILSQGNPSMIESGKNTMINAAIGLAIIFGSYAMINILISVATGQGPAASPTIEGTIEGAVPGSNPGAVVNTVE